MTAGLQTGDARRKNISPQPESAERRGAGSKNITGRTVPCSRCHGPSPVFLNMAGEPARCHSLRDVNVFFFFLKRFHARRDKHPLFGSATAARSALKLYFHCPRVLFIDSVLSVLPCVSSLMLRARLLPCFSSRDEVFFAVPGGVFTSHPLCLLQPMFCFVCLNFCHPQMQTSEARKRKIQQKKKTGRREPAGNNIHLTFADEKIFMWLYILQREATNSARICFFFFLWFSTVQSPTTINSAFIKQSKNTYIYMSCCHQHEGDETRNQLLDVDILK